jgi:hypothetical protein
LAAESASAMRGAQMGHNDPENTPESGLARLSGPEALELAPCRYDP